MADVLRFLLDVLVAIITPIAQAGVWYFQSIINQPVESWLVIGAISAVLFAIIFVLTRIFENIAARICQHPGQENLYKVLWRFRDARDALGQSIGELEHVAGHYAPMMVGKVMVMRYVPPDYPDPADAKALLEDAINLLDQKRFDFTAVQRIKDMLPDINDISSYRGQTVDNNTFAGERAAIAQLLYEVKGEIRRLESLLPPALIWWEKFTLRLRVFVQILLWCMAGVAAITAITQGLLFGLKFLIG